MYIVSNSKFRYNYKTSVSHFMALGAFQPFSQALPSVKEDTESEL